MMPSIRHARKGILACLLILGAVRTTPAAKSPHPIVVAEVSPTAAGAQAGLAPGDLLLAWSHDATPATSAEHPLASVFEFRRLELEESALGVIFISGTRDGEARRWRMPSAPWGIDVRPDLPSDVWKRCAAGLSALEGISPGDEYLADMLNDWSGVVEKAEALGDPLASAWLRAQSGRRLIVDGVRDEGDASWTGAVAAASQAPPEAITTAVVQLYERWAAALDQEGDRDAAMQRLEQGLQAAPDGSLARARLLASLGEMARRLGDLDRAEELLQEAMAIREEAAPGSLVLAQSLYELLLLARARGDLDTADSVGKRALAIQEADDAGSLATANTRSILGTIALMRGDLEIAGERFHSAYDVISEADPGSRDHASAATNLGIVARRRGDAETAMERFIEALAILEALNPTSGAVAMLNNNIGVVAYDYGDLAKSEEHLARALALHERSAPGSLDIALYLDNLAGIAQERGDLAKAERLHRRALTIRETKAPGSLEVAITLANLGDLIQQRGDLERARVYYERALEIQRRLAPESLETAGTLADMGILAERQGDLELAEERYRDSLATREEQAPDSLDVASALSALASLKNKQGDQVAAAEFAQRALAIRQTKTGMSVQTAASLYQLGRLALRRGDAASSATYHRGALELRQKLVPDSHWVASSWNGLGEALRMSGDADSSLEALCRATEILDRDTSRVSDTEGDRASFRAAYSDYYRECIRALVAAGRPEEAFAELERFRARWLLAMLAERDILFEADLPPEVSSRMRSNQIEFDRIVTELSQLDPDEESDAAEARFARMIDLREERQEIAKTIRELSPRLAELQYPEPLGLDAARRILPAGTLYLSYSVGSDSTTLFAVRGKRAGDGPEKGVAALQAFVIAAPREVITAAVRSFRAAIGQKLPMETVEHQAVKLYDLLIRPAEAMMAPGDRLLISPDGPLNALPFAALVREDEEAGRSFLVEQRPLHFVVSASVYAQLEQPLRPRRRNEPVLIAFGDPNYGSATMAGPDALRSFVGRASELRPLPHARHEVESIAQLFEGRTEIHLGTQATETRAKSLPERADYVHFACHGFLDERFPLGSTLAMALPVRGQQDGDNGFLQAWEIIEQIRLEADLVTLSACETGLGADMGGEGLIGLVRAFQYAGARSVVASLWSVADRPTSELMQGFYASLRSGASKADALRSAQLLLIGHDAASAQPEDDERGVRRLVGSATEAGPLANHPYFWAAFQLYGGG